MAQAQARKKKAEAGSKLDELVSLARSLSETRLQSVLDYVRYLHYDEEDEGLALSEDARADMEAYRRGDKSRLVKMDEAWRQLDAQR